MVQILSLAVSSQSLLSAFAVHGTLFIRPGNINGAGSLFSSLLLFFVFVSHSKFKYHAARYAL